MAKKRESGMAYDMPKLHKVFAFLSVLLLIATFWIFLDDYLRPWKAVQIEALRIKQKKIQENIQKESKGIDSKELSSLKQSLVEAKKIVESREKVIVKLEVKLDEIRKEISAETIVKGRLNAFFSEANFNYEHAVGHHYPEREVKKKLKKLKSYKTQFSKSSDRMKALQAKEKQSVRKIASLKKEEIQIKKKY